MSATTTIEKLREDNEVLTKALTLLLEGNTPTDAQLAIAKAAAAPANVRNTASAAPFLEGMLKANRERRALETKTSKERGDYQQAKFEHATKHRR